MADIFLSYRNTDDRREIVKRLALILRVHEVSVWWDYGLEAGESYRAQITRELSQARIVSPLWCTESVKSQWVLLEAELGKDKLVPAKLQHCILPDAFEPIQAADLIGWNGAADNQRVQSFVRNICERLGRKPQAPADTIEQLLHLPPIKPLPERAPAASQRAEPAVDPLLADLRSTWEAFPARDNFAEVARFLIRVRTVARNSGLAYELERHLEKLRDAGPRQNDTTLKDLRALHAQAQPAGNANDGPNYFYQPMPGVRPVEGASRVTVLVTVTDARTENRDRIATLKSAFPRIDVGRVRADVEPLLRNAVEHELQARGFCIGNESVRVSLELTKFYARMEPRIFTADAVGDVAFKIQVLDGDAILYTRELSATGTKGTFFVRSGAKAALEIGLERAVSDLMNDTAFMAVLLATSRETDKA